MIEGEATPCCHALDRPHVVEADVHGRAALACWSVGGDARVGASTGPPAVMTVSPSTASRNSGSEAGRDLRDPEVHRLGRRQWCRRRQSIWVSLPPCVEPALDRGVQPRVGLVCGCGEVDRVQRPGLRAGRDARQRRRVHQQQARARRLGRRGTHPHQHRDPHRRRCGPRGRPRPGRACPRCPSAAPRPRRRPRPGPAVRSGRTSSGRSIAPSTLSTTTSVVGPSRAGEGEDPPPAPATGDRASETEDERGRGRARRMAVPIVPGVTGGILGASPWARRPDPAGRTPARCTTDSAFKPFALLLLIPVVLIASGLMAHRASRRRSWAPPWASSGSTTRSRRWAPTSPGSPRFPERSTIYANDGKTVLATVYLDNREIVHLKNISQSAQEAVLAIEDSGFYQHGAAQLDLAAARHDRERARRRGRGGRLDHHPAAREEHAGPRPLRPDASSGSSRSSRWRSASRRSTRRTRSSRCT